MRRAAIFTISSNNYMPYTTAFIDSSVACHGEADHYLCLADALSHRADFYPKSCSIVTASTLAIPDFQSFSFRYDIMEFNTAVKPYMILHLFALGYDQIIYFDPDIKVYAPITSVFDALENGASVVLTPHLTRPAEGDISPNDITIMRAGIYNLGFVAFGRQSGVEQVLRWWARRLRYQCLNAQADGIFVDQKFIDLVPGFLDNVVVLRDTNLNVAYWNLLQRDLRLVDNGWHVDGKPLIFFHFSGYDSRRSERLSKHTELFADGRSAPLAALLEDYSRDLVARGLHVTPRASYHYERFASDAVIPMIARQIFRETLLTWDGDPFDNFEQYLAQPAVNVPVGNDGAICTNLLAAMHAREPFLRANFNLTERAGVTALVQWFVRHGHHAGIDPRLTIRVVERLADYRRQRAAREPLSIRGDGRDITVVGYLRALTGVGEAARLTLRTLSQGDYSVEGVDIDLNVKSSRSDISCEELISDVPSGRVHIFHINADQLPLVQHELRDIASAPAYRIAIPFWELANLPDVWATAFDQVDEIWAPTRFIQHALITKLHQPVLHMPLALDLTPANVFQRSHYGLEENRFIFLFSFDFLSFSGRKNPLAVLTAFRRAFAGTHNERDVTLVIKCVNANLAVDEMGGLRRGLPSALDIRFIDTELSRVEMLELIRLSDCVVSLHRSEGLGLLVAEAMAMETPVIATDYSATTEILSTSTGYPVDYKLIPIEVNQYPMAHGQYWADPDIAHASWQMRQAFESSDRSMALTTAARQFIEREHSTASVLHHQVGRLRELGIDPRPYAA